MNDRKLAFYLRLGLVLLLLTAVLLLFLPAKAETATQEWTFDTGSGELTLRGTGAVCAVSWQSVANRIQKVTVAEGITALPEDAFAGCTKLCEAVLPEGLSALGSRAFAGCCALSSLTLPGSLSRLGADVFDGCTGLTNLRYTGTSAQWRGLCQLLTDSVGNALPAALTPEYTLPTFRYTVIYLAEDGTSPASPRFITLTKGDSYTLSSPEIPGYRTDTPTLILQAEDADRQYVVYYYPITCTLTLQYTDENGRKLRADRILTLPFGTAVEETPPAIAGYEAVKNGTLTLESLTEDNLVWRFLYSPVKLSVTVQCVDEAGNLLADPLTVSQIPYGGAWYLSLPEIAEYVPLKKNVSGENLTENATVRALYRPQYQTVTVSYLDRDGYPMQPGSVFRVKTGDNLSVDAPVIDGYTVDFPTLTAANIINSVSLHFTYAPNVHTLTLRCLDGGGILLKEVTESVAYGTSYTVNPPDLPGYELLAESMPPDDTMPDTDVVLTVVFREDGESPLLSPTLSPAEPSSSASPTPTATPDAAVTDPSDTDAPFAGTGGKTGADNSMAWVWTVLGILLLLTGITLYVLLYNRFRTSKNGNPPDMQSQ